MTDTQISVGMNVDGVVTGTEKAKRKISELGGAAREAGKGTGAIGDGMAGAATKVEAATKNMVGSIQRQIAALEAGDKSSRQYQESLARMRGIDVAALRPYLDQLDQVKLRQAEAAKTAESFASSLGTMRMAGLAVAAAGGAVALFAKSIIDAADGLNDMSQRVGISVRELGKYQLAAEQSGASLESISKGVKGLSDNMIKHGDALRKAGIDATTADGAMQQLADVFADMPDGIEKTALATKLFGKAGMDLIPMLNLGSEGLRDAAIASADYAEQMAIMAPLADALNDSMAEIALASKTAGAVMVNEFLPTLNAIALAFLDSKDNANGFASVAGGTVKTVLQTLALVTSDVVFVLNGMGREIGAIAAQVAALGRLDFKGFTAIGDAVKEDAERARKELDRWQSDLVNGVAKADAAVQSAYNKRQGFGEKSGARGSRLLGDLGGDSAAKKALAEQNKELANQAKILAELSGYSADYEATQQRYAAMLKSGAMGQEAYNRAAQELVAKQPGMVAAAKAQAEAQKEITKTHADYVASLQKSVIAGDEELAKAQAAYDAHGKLASVLQEELIARMEITRDQIAGGAGSEADLSAIDAQIKAKRELVKVLRSGEVRDASEKAAKDAAEEWKKASEKIEQDITDALMRGFESGKGFAEVLKDTIENTFKTMVIRPVIQATVQGGLNAVGLGSAQGGGTINGIGGAINTANSMNSIYAAGSQFLYGSSVGASAASLAAGNMAGMVGGDALGTMIAANGSWAGVSAGTAAGTAAAGSMTSAMAAIPGWGWAAMAAVAVAGILKGHGETRSGATYDTGADGLARYQQGPSGGEIAGDTARAMFNATKTSIQDTLKLVGSSATVTGYTAGLESSGKGKGFAFAGGFVDGKSFGDSDGREGHVSGQWKYQAMNAEQAMAAYVNELKKSTLEALQAATDIPAIISNQLAGVDINALNQEGLDNLMAAVGGTIDMVNGFTQAANLSAMQELHDLSFEVAAGLIAASGGMEALNTNLGSYYTNFYSAEEQRLQTIKTINAATAGSGLDAATATREQFRALVEAQDLTTESGRATYAALLGVSGAMGALDAAAAKLAETNQGWQDQLDVLTGKTTERDIALRDATDESTRAIMRQVYAQEDLRTALERTIADTQNAADDLVALYGDVVTAMLTISPPVKSLVDQWSESTAELTALTQGLADALGELPEATALDRLKTTLATLASATNGIADISEQIFGLQAGRGDQSAVNLLQGRETALFAELTTSNDPGAVAAKLASTMLTRIKLQGELADKVTNDALKSQFDASTTLAQLEKTNRDKQIDAIRKQISAAETLLDVVGSMKGYLAELRFGDLSALNPGDQLSAAQGNYNTLLSGAQGGDTKAMQDLQGGASNYLKEAQGYYGGATSQYASIFQAVTSGLEQFGATPVTDITLLQNQLGYLEKIEAASIDLQTVVTDTTDLQIEGLNSINTVLTTRQDEARQEAADNKKAVQEQIAELKAIVAGQEAQIKQQAAIYEGLMERLTTATKALESLDNTSKQTAAAPV